MKSMSMKNILISVFIVIVFVSVALVGYSMWRRGSQVRNDETAIMKFKNMEMRIISSAFMPMAMIPVQYTCDGDAKNPPLLFGDVPATAQSLALILDDPDVPKTLKPDGLFVHWVMWNIDPKIAGIAENSVPAGAMVGQGGSGKNEYVGPCPPDREHRYFFKLYALDTRLDLPATTGKAELEQAMQGHIIGQAELIGVYDRKR